MQTKGSKYFYICKATLNYGNYLVSLEAVHNYFFFPLCCYYKLFASSTILGSVIIFICLYAFFFFPSREYRWTFYKATNLGKQQMSMLDLS